jgi:hypothetical protein
MQQKISRRAIVKGGLVAGALVPAFGLFANSVNAAGLPPLDPSDPTAKSLGFVTDPQAHADVRHVCAVPGQAGRRIGWLQYFCGPQCSQGWMVQGLGAETGRLIAAGQGWRGIVTGT